jgi:hypothetical protein
MNSKVRIFVGLVFFIVLIFSGTLSFSQPPGNGRPCPQEPCPATPIAGVEILLVGGAALGIRKLLKSKKSVA